MLSLFRVHPSSVHGIKSNTCPAEGGVRSTSTLALSRVVRALMDAPGMPCGAL